MLFRVNGAAIFARGANVIPVRLQLRSSLPAAIMTITRAIMTMLTRLTAGQMDELEGWYDADAHRQMVQSAADASMNMLRVWGAIRSCLLTKYSPLSAPPLSSECHVLSKWRDVETSMAPPTRWWSVLAASVLRCSGRAGQDFCRLFSPCLVHIFSESHYHIFGCLPPRSLFMVSCSSSCSFSCSLTSGWLLGRGF